MRILTSFVTSLLISTGWHCCQGAFFPICQWESYLYRFFEAFSCGTLYLSFLILLSVWLVIGVNAVVFVVACALYMSLVVYCIVTHCNDNDHSVLRCFFIARFWNCFAVCYRYLLLWLFPFCCCCRCLVVTVLVVSLGGGSIKHCGEFILGA